MQLFEMKQLLAAVVEQSLEVACPSCYPLISPITDLLFVSSFTSVFLSHCASLRENVELQLSFKITSCATYLADLLSNFPETRIERAFFLFVSITSLFKYIHDITRIFNAALSKYINIYEYINK